MRVYKISANTVYSLDLIVAIDAIVRPVQRSSDPASVRTSSEPLKHRDYYIVYSSSKGRRPTQRKLFRIPSKSSFGIKAGSAR